MVKTSLGTSGANSAQTITITSPNTKYIKLCGYSVSYKGAAVPAADITIDFKDEDNNVLWQDIIPRGTANSGTTVARYHFGNCPIYCPTGKNLKCVIGAGGASVITVASVLWNI